MHSGLTLCKDQIYGNSSVGRASVSKTEGREFESYFPCKIIESMFKKVITYCKNSYEELAHKTTWPSRKDLTHSALIVLTASIIIALVVFAMDKIFQFVMTTVYPG